MTTLNDYRLISLATLYPQMDIPGWTKNNDFQSLCDNIWTGFKAAVYEKTNSNGKKTIVIAFECFQKFNDLPSVIQSITGFHSLQENNADILYNAVKEYYINEDIQIEFTGLSYGGTLAQLMGIKHRDSQVVTFAALSASHIQWGNTNISYNNIENHISINDFVGNFYEQIGNTYYYYPDSLQDKNIQQTHSDFINRIDLIGQNEYNFIKNIENWKPQNSYSIIKYDYNFDKNNLFNDIILALPQYISASENDLKDSIDIINKEYFLKQEKLHYVTTWYSYIIGSIFDENGDHEILGLNNQKNIIWGNGGLDVIKGMNFDDLIIGDYTTYKVRELENILANPSLIDEAKFSDSRYANESNDQLYGGSGNDVLIGCGGNDILIGGKDKDTLYGGRDNDLLIAGETKKTQEELQNIINNNGAISVTDFESDNSQNTMYGGIGNDIIIGDKGCDTIYGGGDDDIIYGGEGSDTIYGDDEENTHTGNDIIVGGKGGDTIYGGKGEDFIIAGNSTLSKSAIEQLKSIPKNIDIYQFESDNLADTNTLNGGDNNDIIIGDRGRDIIHGDAGNDYIFGGRGDDDLYGDDGDDYVYGGDGSDIIEGGKGNDYLDGGNGTDIIEGGENNDILVGGSGHDVLDGGADNDVLIAGGSSATEEQIKNVASNKQNVNTALFESDSQINTLNGGDGSDVLVGDMGKDYLYGEDGNDYIYGGKGEDYIEGGSGNDYIYGGDDKDTIKGDDGDDHIYGDDGDDNIDGGAGNDTIYGGEGKDTIKGGDGNDTIYGEDGDDIIEGGDSNDTIYGGAGKDVIDGGSGNDKLYAGAGNGDVLKGGSGSDNLYNYEGNATLQGGVGYDTYYVTSSSTNIIYDEDNQGSVNFNSKTLRGAGKDDYKENDTWVKDGVTYVWTGNTLSINGRTTIQNFSNGALGITLNKPEEDDDDEDPMDADDKMTEPIVLDLNGDGVKTTITAQGINFDYNNDGFAEKIAWANIDDGVLVADLNNNGKIDNGTEVLNAETLADFDTNNDGVIDENDENFSALKVMKVDGSLLSMEEAGIASINASVTSTDTYDENGNNMFGEGTFTKTDGSVNRFGEYNLVTDFSNTQASNILEETEDVAELPDIEGKGRLYSLHQAILHDESGELQALVESFVSETNDSVRNNLIEQILYKWADCENIAENSRGEYINAKHLALWEAFQGIDFVSRHEGESDPTKPNKEAADKIETKVQKFMNEVYAKLMQQTHLQTYYDAIDKINAKYDLSPVVAMLDAAMNENSANGRELVYQVIKMIKGLGIDKYSNFFDPKNDDCLYSKYIQNDRELKWLIDTVGKVGYISELDATGNGEGTAADDSFQAEEDESSHFHALAGDDVMYGDNGNDNFYACDGDDILDGGDGDDVLASHAGNDIIFGGAGNDTIHAAWGNDIIFGGDGDDLIYPDHSDDFNYSEDGDDIIRGGKGNDTIYSMTGNDTFIFNPGDDQDTVYERQGIDTFYFGNGISWEDLTFTRSENDMVISINNTTDQITVKDWFEEKAYSNDNNKIEIFEFADGSKHYLDEITIDSGVKSITYNMAELENDYIEITSNYKTIVNLKSGWNHIVEGLNNNSTFVLSEQGTNALIQNFSGTNTIQFAEGITLENTIFDVNEDGLHISFNNFDAHLTIQGDFDTDTTFNFSDETVITDIKDYLRSDISYTDYTMNQNQEELTLLGYDNVTAAGNDLDNTIRGNEGNTTFEGKGGNDRLESLNGGNDTYIYNLGDGQDTIIDIGGYDTIQFGEGITQDNIRFLRDLTYNNLEISFDIENHWDDRLIIENYFGSDENKIEKLIFSDGTELNDISKLITAIASENDITLPENIHEAHLWGDKNTSATGNDLDNWFGGNAGDNTFEGGKGNDSYCDGNGGNDRYIYNLGDGHDYIENVGGLDAIIFGEGISKDNISFSQNEDNNGLEITFQNQEGSIFIANYFNGDENKIELFKFADGTVIDNIAPYLDNQIENIQNNSIVMDADQVSASVIGNGDASVLGNNLDNEITGNAGNNAYAAGGGDDTITDVLGGNDTYLYNFSNGHDTITDLGGIDTIKFGSNIYPDSLKFERVENNLLISFKEEWRDGSLTINNYFLNDDYKIENFIFDDGTVLTDISDRITGAAPTTNYTMAEDTNIDTVRMAGSDNINVTGNNNDNTICGNSGNNTFEGKGGNDTLIDHQGGNDIYLYNLGDGNDTIDDVGGYDTIRFGSGITTENLAFMQTESDLNIWFHNIENDGLSIKNYFSNPDNKIEKFELSDGTVITDISNYITAIASEENIILPNNVPQAHLWGEGNTSATGNDLDNWFGGNSGDNTFEGKGGNDYFYDDQGGNDTYIYNLGDGWDTISDFGGRDTIKFGNNISAQNLVFIRNDGNLQINFQTNDGEYVEGGICIENYFYDDNKRIEKIEFADGSTITNIDSKINTVASENDFGNYWNCSFAQLWENGDISYTGSYSDETINGNSGNNTYNPQGGTDYIYDTQGGNDTYIYNHDSQNKFILDIGGNDTIKFGSGIDLQNTKFVQEGNNLRIYFVNANNAFIRIENYFATDDDYKIERFEFIDGTVITDVSSHLSGIASYENISLSNSQSNAYLLGDGNNSVTGSLNDDNIIGNSGDNTYNAGAGNDRIEDKNGGDDTYIYNLGDGYDCIADIHGNDTIIFGNGISLDNVRFNQRNNDLEIKIDANENSGNIYIEKYFLSDARKIENIQFSDGTTITNITPYLSGITINSDYTLEENSNISELFMNGKKDLSVVGNSQDNHFEGNSGNNTFEGKGGNDSFYDDQGGNDTYIYNIGDGFDWIYDKYGYDTIILGAGITASMLTMNKWDDGQLEITFDGIEGNIVIDNYFNNIDNKIEKIILHDGTEITDFTPYFTTIETDVNYTAPENSKVINIIATGEDNISLTGKSNDNHFVGNSGNNTFEGKQGNDSYWDEAGGNDTYKYKYGDGWDWIHDKYGNDTIEFGQGITTDNTQFVKQNNNLEICILDENGWGIGNTVVENYFDPTNDYKIETVKFADGTIINDLSDKIYGVISETENIVLTGNQIEGIVWGDANLNVTGNNLDNHINGNAGNNVMTGGQGNDSFWDEEGGNDTYVYNIGDGYDWIHDKFGYDTIQLGEGITASMLTINKWQNGELEITFDGIDGNIVIDNYFNDVENRIERIVFSDGTEITDFSPYATFVETDTNYTAATNTKIKDITATGSGNISITGNANNNTIRGNGGNNTFEGKGGDDHFYDEEGGNDTYIYNLGDGCDYICDVGGNDTIRFGTGLTLENTSFMKTDDGLNIFFENNIDGNIIVEDYWNNPDKKIENFVFSDNTTITDISNYIKAVSSNSNVILPDSAENAHLWGNGNTSAIGNSSNNWFWGNSGNNTYQGKGGDDHFYDEEGGNDTYIYNLGDGCDYISDIGGNDTIRLGTGITSSMLKMRKQDNGNLEILFDGENGNIVVENYFNNDNNKIEKIVLSDNTEITDFTPYYTFVETDTNYTASENSKVIDITATGNGNISLTGNSNNNNFYGNSGNNTYQGKGGNDSFFDFQCGNDTYIYNFGDGNDYINDVGGNDTIKFGDGINLNNIGIMRDDYNNMHVRFENGQEIIIQSQYDNNENKIENIEFADGTVVTNINSLTNQIGSDRGNIVLPNEYTEAHLWGDGNYSITGNNDDNFIRGNAGNNVLEGKGGNDNYWELEGGNDTYIYSAGDGFDWIQDQGGNDTISFGSGISLEQTVFTKTNDNSLLITFQNQDGHIWINDYFNTDIDKRIENFSFADGTVLTDISDILVDNSSSVDVNQLIQEMNSYAPEGEMINGEYNQNQEELILAMT